eukprot:TRINITY_DN4600_c0_g1_i7.p1 TRINITY_DN4600_c0_g1~~TRINITY_DN4600_c0_g1_i7.p1  ORF type:complete len:100 (-),score=7.32 TRINITY_DN4600_c0_g1_i7:457-756(-)
MSKAHLCIVSRLDGEWKDRKPISLDGLTVFGEFLDRAGEKLSIYINLSCLYCPIECAAKRAFTENGEEILSLEDIREDEFLLISEVRTACSRLISTAGR